MDTVQRLKAIKEKNDKLTEQKNNYVTELRIEESKLEDALKDIGLTSASQITETKGQIEQQLEVLIKEAEGLIGE